MYLFYADESGDPGLKKSKTDAFVVSVTAVRDVDWPSTLDAMIGFRRWVKTSFKVKMSDEIKAGYIIHGTGPLTGINEKARMRLYRQAMKFQPKIATMTTWAVAVDKDALRKRIEEAEGRGSPLTPEACDVRRIAWTTMVERLERFTTKKAESGMLFPDEGHHLFIRAILRQKRRHSVVPSMQGSGGLSRPALLMVEDPVSLVSGESYFTQFADLNAYAAYRRVFPQPWCDGRYWDLLGPSINTQANRYSNGPPGIVVRN